MTKEKFEALEPGARGYTVYMAGCHPDQPNIPDEKNPYPEGSVEHKRWEDGAMAAYLAVLDSEE